MPLEAALITAITGCLLAVAELVRLEVSTRRERAAVAAQLAQVNEAARGQSATHVYEVDITDP